MKQLNPKAVYLFFIQSFISIFFAVVIIAAWIIPTLLNIGKFVNDGSSSPGVFGAIGGGFIVIVILITVILSLVWSKLVYNNYRYELSESGFKKEEGVIIKRYTTIPYERIQNIDINRGIFARLLGLSDLQIQTAGMSSGGRYGAGGVEGRLVGLSHTDAELLRDELVRRARGIQNQGV